MESKIEWGPPEGHHLTMPSYHTIPLKKNYASLLPDTGFTLRIEDHHTHLHAISITQLTKIILYFYRLPRYRLPYDTAAYSNILPLQNLALQIGNPKRTLSHFKPPRYTSTAFRLSGLFS